MAEHDLDRTYRLLKEALDEQQIGVVYAIALRPELRQRTIDFLLTFKRFEPIEDAWGPGMGLGPPSTVPGAES